MRLLTLTVAVLVSGAPLGAQSVAAAPAAMVAVPQSDGYSYQPAGRRDPFLSLVNGGGADVKSPAARPDGVRAFSLAEISVRGILQSRNALVAMVQGPDNRTYLIHQGDKLADAVVKNITPQGLIVMQDISDPLSVQKQREVRKLLRSLEGAEK